MNKFFFTFVFTFLATLAFSQTEIGIKGGLSINNEKWKSTSREVVLGFHSDVFFEFPSPQKTFSFLVEAGYHTRGSALKGNIGYDTNGDGVNDARERTSYPIKFNNLKLMPAFKDFFILESKFKPYYVLGPRIEFTIKENLGIYKNRFQPVDLSTGKTIANHVNKFNYGFTFGGGFEYELNKIGFLIEATYYQDLSNQVYHDKYNYRDQSNNLRTFPEQSVRNFGFEISLGIKFRSNRDNYDRENWIDDEQSSLF